MTYFYLFKDDWDGHAAEIEVEYEYDADAHLRGSSESQIIGAVVHSFDGVERKDMGGWEIDLDDLALAHVGNLDLYEALEANIREWM